MDMEMKAAKQHYEQLMGELEKLGMSFAEFEAQLGGDEGEEEAPEMMGDEIEEGEDSEEMMDSESKGGPDKTKIAIMIGKLKKKPKEEY